MEILVWFIIGAGLLVLLVMRLDLDFEDLLDWIRQYWSGLTGGYHKMPPLESGVVESEGEERLRKKQAEFQAQEAPSPNMAPPAKSRAELMPIIVSGVVLGAALVIILTPNLYPDTHQKWAFGVVGLIVGHWLKK